MRLLMILLLCLAVFSTESVAAPASTGTFALCMNQRGAIVAKKKCSRKETRLNADSLGSGQSGGGTGLSVYDANGTKIGPLIGLGQTIVDIEGKKYSLRFGRDGALGNTTIILFSGPSCGGTAYARYLDEIDAYSQIASAVIAKPGRTLYLVKSTLVEPIAHESAYTTSTTTSSCREGPLNEDPQRGFEVDVKGDVDQLFPGPFDVRE